MLRNKKSYWIVSGVVTAIIVGILALFFLSENETHTILLTEYGFEPNEITIATGDTVVFTTNTESEFWPASNVHPTHSNYPDFDPKRPLRPNESWSFTFTESGEYLFHDHIHATYEGVIHVVAASGLTKKPDCDSTKNPRCWEELMLQTLEEQGVEAAFDQLVYFSENDPSFTKDCHGYAHLIGEDAYSLYESDTNFKLTPATSLCGYGFYHGFMETLLLTTGNIQEARDFCEMADQKLAGQASAASTACYHGTGHGAVDGSDPTAWGDIDAIMEPGFELCDTLAQTELQSYLCDTGVFNATEIISRDPKYGIGYIADDPYALCNEQPLERREACYSNMLPLLISKFDGDVDAIFQYTNENMIDNESPAIDEHTINELVTIGIGFEYIRAHQAQDGYMEKGIALCRRQDADDQLACIQGLSGGHIKYGPPGKEYIKNLEFCAHQELSVAERDACYSYTLPRLGNRYTKMKIEEICQQVDVTFREKYCN